MSVCVTIDCLSKCRHRDVLKTAANRPAHCLSELWRSFGIAVELSVDSITHRVIEIATLKEMEQTGEEKGETEERAQQERERFGV